MVALPSTATAQEPSELNDLEMAHVAVTANNIDIAYAHLALAFSSDPDVRAFAQRMIAEHTAVNEKIAALAEQLGVTAQDNPMSRQLRQQAEQVKTELSRLRGAAFDRRYLQNELEYHKTVNGVVADAFIPNIENPQVKDAFRQALALFRGHEVHVAALVEKRTSE